MFRRVCLTLLVTLFCYGTSWGAETSIQGGTGAVIMDDWCIYGIIPGSPADNAGIMPGDLITSINGISVTNRLPVELKSEYTGEVGKELRLIINSQNIIKEIKLNLANLTKEDSWIYVAGNKDMVWDNLLDVITYQTEFDDKVNSNDSLGLLKKNILLSMYNSYKVFHNSTGVKPFKTKLIPSP